MSKHYVVKVEVERVERPVLQKGDQYKPEMLGDRVITELGKVILKGEDLDVVVEDAMKAAYHIKDFE